MSAEVGRLSGESLAYARLEAALDGLPWPPLHKSVSELSNHREPVELVVYVYEAERLTKRDGNHYASFVVGDAKHKMRAKAWSNHEEALRMATQGRVVKVHGHLSVSQKWGTEIVLERVGEAGPGDYDSAQVVPSAESSCTDMVWELEDFIDALRDDGLRELLRRLLWHGDIAPRWAESPAAMTIHQAYRHGLMEHSLQVARMTRSMAAELPGLDCDLAIAGALLHDIGKVETYALENGEIQFTDAGRLEGEIVLGRGIVANAIRETDPWCLCPERAEALLHIVVSHHGTREHGSPVEPCTPVAALVHLLDKISATVGNYARMEQMLRAGETWGAYDRTINGFPFFGGRPAEDSAAS